MPRSLIFVHSLLAACLLAQVPATAQRVDQTRIIDLHVNAEAQDRSFGGSVAEGQGFRMTFQGVATFEIVPVIVDEARGTFRVTVYRGPVNGEAADLRAVETVSARLGVPVALRSMPSAGLVIEGVRRAAPRAQVRPAAFNFTRSAPARMARATLGDRCCVTCGTVTSCACRVINDCGNCCVNPCCPPPVETSNDRFLPAPRTLVRLAGQCGDPIRDEERIHTSAARPAAVLARR